MRRLILISFLAALCFGAQAQDASYTDDFITATALYAEGDYVRAGALLSRLLEKNPDDDAVCYYLGLCEFAGRRMVSAENYLEKACSIDSTNTWYLNALASAYEAEGKNGLAAPLYEKMLELKPSLFTSAYTLSMVADSKLAAGQDSVALNYYDKALQVEPRFAPAEIGRAEIFRMRGNFPAYFVELNRFVTNENVTTKALADYIRTLLESIDGRFYRIWGKQINLVVDSFVEARPDEIMAHDLKLNMCAIEQDNEGMMEQCRIMSDLALADGDTENFVKYYATVGDLYHEMGDEKRCFECYKRVLEYDPEYAPVLNNYAYYLCESRKSLRKALKMSKVAVGKEPDNATFLDTYGWILHLLRKDKEAKPVFKHAMIYGGRDSGVILGHFSKVLEALGEDKLADYYKSLAEQRGDK